MDADRFDSLSRSMAAPTTRRATLGAMVASALGLGAVAPTVQAAQGQVCTMAFVTTVRLGPSVSQPLTPDGNQPGQLQGELRFSLSQTGNLENAAFQLSNGTNLPVVGQATGHALQLRIALDENLALVAQGVGAEEIAACKGAVDGTTAGPQTGDLGEWHARAKGLTGETGAAGGGNTKAAGGGNTKPAGSGNTKSAGGGNTNRDRAGGATAGSAATSQGGQGGSSGTQESTAETGRAKREGRTTPTPTPSTAQPGSAPQCAAGQTPCNGVCVDVTTNAGNCGLCGFQCAAGEACVGGSCQPQANQASPCGAPGQTNCGGVCVNLANDQAHCGACGQACAAGVDCVNSVCGGSCPAGQTDCGDCADLMTNATHCGDCSTACAAGETCAAGVCTGAAAADGGDCAGQGLTLCGAGCTDTATDTANCGFCDIACAVGETCQAGFCTGPAAPAAEDCAAQGLTECGGGTCVDTSGDSANCGGCGVVCQGDETCIAGFCTGPEEAAFQDCAAQGLTDCGGVCVDTSTDSANCSFCGTACAAGTSCIGGGCV
jgi:hypothetical protein